MRTRTCYLYVLPLAYEDIAKLGLSHDPLARAQAFARRYYEFFDLSRSLLVEFDSRREAQARETQLHRRLRDWNAAQPLTVPGAAAGQTEWYRGAYAALRTSVEEDAAGGRVVHAPATGWWKARLLDERERLYEWAAQALRECAGDRRAALRLLADALDAYAAFEIPVQATLPPELAGIPSSIATTPGSATGP